MKNSTPKEVVTIIKDVDWHEEVIFRPEDFHNRSIQPKQELTQRLDLRKNRNIHLYTLVLAFDMLSAIVFRINQSVALEPKWKSIDYFPKFLPSGGPSVEISLIGALDNNIVSLIKYKSLINGENTFECSGNANCKAYMATKNYGVVIELY